VGSVFYLDGRLRRQARAELLRKESGAERAGQQSRPRSLLRLGYNSWTIAHAERAAFIVDAKDYFAAFYRAALAAQRSIIILGWDFNSRTQLHYDAAPADGPPARLGEFLNYLTRRRRGLHVHVLNWDYPIVFGADRELPPIYGLGDWTPGRRVHLRYDDAHPVGASQHQKVVVIDDALAFVGGIDLTVRRWDCCEHTPGDPRRTAYDKPYPPFHDTMIAVDGEAARQLGELARERWRLATGHRLKPLEVQSDPWPAELEPDVTSVEVGIARTLPPRGELPAVREVERLYLDMIAAARRTIYIENQYFTAPRIAAALEKRLAEPDGPEVVLVLRLLSHGWLEEATMHVLRTRLIDRLHKADRHDRFRVYYPHIPGLAEGTCVDVHSKLMIVDDSLVRIGSSNLCNRSMALDSECDLVIESRGEPHIAAAIVELRDRLLAEHLNTQPARVRQEIERAGSVHGAIAAFRAEARTLRQFDELPQWPETVLSVAAVADPEEPIALETLLSEREAHLEASKDKPAWGKLAGIVLAIAALMALWRFTPLKEAATPEAAIAWAKTFGRQPWAPWVLMAAYTPACLVMFPRPLITLASVIAFGPWLGFLYSLTGICCSSAATWWMGRHMRRDTVRRLAGKRLDRMAEVLKKHGLLAMTLLRLVPLAPFAVESIVAGAIRMRLWHVVVGTAIGLLPGTLTTTVFGDAIETAVTGSGQVNWWLVGGALGTLAGGAWAVKRWFTRMERRMQAHGEAVRQPR
jgi:phosphatidylserine/phosphatidylglycerophosphate/cardiolipin synthase-like enzyme/membrane protein DedA with SNARE-associated domain